MVCTCPGTALTCDRGSGRSMLGQSGHSATVSDLLGWSILLAREPDLDLEFEEQPHKHPVKQPAPRTPKQTGGKRGLLIVRRVMVFADPALPPGPVPLTIEAGGTRSSFTIRPGATVTVVDGELRNNAWVYAVRTEDGAQGWIQEKRLKAKP